MAAVEILAETGKTDFTLHELVERSRASLRSFYQHFASKDELLLAVFEEELNTFLIQVRTNVDAAEDPLERIKIMMDMLLTVVESDSPLGRVSRALTIYHMQLTESHPRALADVLEPQFRLTMELIEAGVTAGVVREDVPAEQLAELVMRTSIAITHAKVLDAQVASRPMTADHLWDFCLGGIRVQPNASTTPRKLRRSRF